VFIRAIRVPKILVVWLASFALGLIIAACARAVTEVPLDSVPTPARGLTATADVQAGVLNPDLSGPAPAATPLHELGVGQHISSSGSFSQTETEAAGPMACRIERGSCAYGYLAAVSHSAIRFTQEEPPPYGDEDRLVHPAMVEPLIRLADLVTAEWNGEYLLTVTDAYDSLLDHDLAQPDPARKYSLHFEGRSIDLILVPLGLDRLGRMCALAHQAGFDWVHNEGDHCHASVRADSLCSVCSGAQQP
jgi:hypothetical protein